MRWRSGRRSNNIEDRRGRRMKPLRRGAKLGGGATIIVLLVSLFLGADPQALLNTLGGLEGSGASTSSASGPFYCPGDNQVYIDLSFFRQLKQMGAPGDFAQAYVIGHEVGHHIQNITGTSQKVRSMQARADRTRANALSVKQELQADCYAGVWAYHSNKDRNMLEEGDVEEGLRAAAAIGDDALMRGSGRSIRPESFTHGSSKQRIKWLRIGLETGSPDACNTFANS